MKTLSKYERGLVQGFAMTISYMLSVLSGDTQAVVMTIEDGMLAFAKWEELVKYCPEELERWGEEENPYSRNGTFADWYRFSIFMKIGHSGNDFRLMEQIMTPFDKIEEWTFELSDKWLKDYKNIKKGNPVDGIKYYLIEEYGDKENYGFDDYGFRYTKGNNALYIKSDGEIVYGTCDRIGIYKMRFDLIEDLFQDGVIEFRRE